MHVGRLRKALNRGHAADPIRTVRGAGYALDDTLRQDRLTGGDYPAELRRPPVAAHVRRLIGDARVVAQ